MTVFAMPTPTPVLTPLLALAGARRGEVELTNDRLHVRLGHGWSTTVPRSSIRTARPDERTTVSVGAHGWRGRWLVNTSTRGLVRMEFDPPAVGRCLGLRHSLSELTVSLADPEAFLAELGVRAA